MTHDAHPKGSDNDRRRPWTGRAVLHVDMDAFFASVEQLDHPEWRGRPVVVGGSPDSRGVIAAASYEARKFGVRSAMPSSTAARLCPDLVWAPARFARYRELSSAVMGILRETTPVVQQVSVDEAYLDVTPGRTGPHPVEVAEDIQERVAGLGLSCSIGVATSKTVAKIASDMRKPHGLVVVWPGEESRVLAPMPVEALQGVGKVTAQRLRSLGVRTLGELAALDGVTAAQVLGSHGPDAVRRAAGIDGRPVMEGERRKSVSKEHTFASDVSDPDEVTATLTRLAEEVGVRVRGKGLAGRTVTVKLRFADFTTKTLRRTLTHPVDSEGEFAPVALALVRSAWSPGVGLRLLGVGLSGFEERSEQLDLLSPEAASLGRETDAAVIRSLDAVRERFGPDAIGVGRRGLKRAVESEGTEEGSERGDGEEPR